LIKRPNFGYPARHALFKKKTYLKLFLICEYFCKTKFKAKAINRDSPVNYQPAEPPPDLKNY